MKKLIIFFLFIIPFVSLSIDKKDKKEPKETEKQQKEDSKTDNIIKSPFIDGCSGPATFTFVYDAVNNCYIFTNTTNNDCGTNGICTWDFGDGSPTVTTVQGANTICHQFPDCNTYTISLTYNATACYPTAICYGSYSIAINTFVPSNLSILESNFNGFNISCPGLSDGWIQIDSVPLCSIVWDNGDVTWITQSRSAGIINATITDDQGCNFIFIDNLIEPTSITNSAITTNISCYNYSDGAINITPNGGVQPYNYYWSNTYTTQDLNSISAGLYSVDITDTNNCVQTFQFQLTEPSPLTTSYSTSNFNGFQISCNGLNDGFIDYSVTGSVPPYNFLWSSGQTSEDIYNLNSGAYTLTITDDHQCIGSETIIITQPTPLITSVVVSSSYNGYDISCYGYNDGSVDLSVSGSVPSYNYSWDNGLTTEDISSLTIGMYTVNIIDLNGCTISDSIILTEPLPLVSTISSTTNFNGYDISCNSYSDGNIDVGVYGSVPPYNYQWNNSITTQDLNSVTSGFYSINIFDANNCYSYQDITLTEPTPFLSTNIISNYNGVNISCFGFSDGYIDFELMGSVPPYSYLWNTNAATQDIINVSVGNYSVIVTDNNGCVYSDSFDLYQPFELSTIESVSDACFRESNGVALVTIIGGTPAYTENWGGVNPNNLSAGIYFYNILDINNCLYSDSVVINQPSDSLTVTHNITDVSCFGGIDGSVSLNISGSTPPYYTDWTNNINPNLLVAGTYYYEVLDFNGCDYLDSVIISQPLPYNVVVNVTNISCFNGNDGSISLNITGNNPPYIVDWGGISPTLMIAGTYSFTITDTNQCLFSGITIVNEPNPIDVIYSVILPSCSNSTDGQISLIISGGTSPYSIDWNGSNPNSLSVGTHHLIVTDSNNCIDSNQIFLQSRSNMSVSESSYDLSCKGFCDGEANLIINNGIPPYNINWFINNPDSLCEGIYYYEITDSLGCIFSDSVYIDSPDSLSLSISAINNQILMANAVGGSPPYTFNWFNNTSQLGNTQSILITTSAFYYCVAYDQNHCQTDTIKYFYSDVNLNDLNLGNLSVYPIPSSGVVFISFNSYFNQDLQINIKNVIGQNLIERELTNFKGDYLYKFNLSDYASGLYLLEIITDKGRLNQKLILE
jgi:hypothetical protein